MDWRQRLHRGGTRERDREVHKYAARLFHISNKTVWEYVSRFAHRDGEPYYPVFTPEGREKLAIVSIFTLPITR